MSITTQEKKKEYNDRYYIKNRDKIRKQQKENYQLNREELLEKQKVRSKKYYEKNRDKIIAAQRYKYINNIDGAYDKKSLRFKNMWQEIRNELFELLGGAFCVKCNFSDKRALQIDHVNGGGNKHRNTLTSHRQFADYVKLHLNEFQVLCANCNRIKVYENKEVRIRNVVIS